MMMWRRGGEEKQMSSWQQHCLHQAGCEYFCCNMPEIKAQSCHVKLHRSEVLRGCHDLSISHSPHLQYFNKLIRTKRSLTFYQDSWICKTESKRGGFEERRVSYKYKEKLLLTIKMRNEDVINSTYKRFQQVRTAAAQMSSVYQLQCNSHFLFLLFCVQ